MKRPVRLGTKDMDNLAGGPFLKLQHWAVRVGKRWFEVAAGAKERDGQNSIDNTHGAESRGGVNDDGWEDDDSVYRVGKYNPWNLVRLLPLPYLRYSTITLVGSTLRDDEEIERWIDRWEGENPEYNFMTGNCQKFAYELIMWLTDGAANVPMPEAAFISDAKGASAMAVTAKNETKARATLGQYTGHYSVLGVKGELPNASAGAHANATGVGAYANAELFRAEANIGIGQVYISPNLNTGIGKLEDGKVGLNVLGFGVSVGKGLLNWRVNTPLGGVNLFH